MRRLIPLAAAIALLFPASRSVSSQVQADDANVLSDAIMTYMTGYTNSWMSGENTDALGKYVPPEDSGGSPPQPPAPLPPETVPKEDIIDVKGDSTTPDPTKPQDEVVIPVSGDSSSPVDEVMDGGSYALLRPGRSTQESRRLFRRLRSHPDSRTASSRCVSSARVPYQRPSGGRCSRASSP